MIGILGTICGKHNVNIANFALGRNAPGGDAIALLYVDEQVPAEAIKELTEVDAIKAALPLVFNVENV